MFAVVPSRTDPTRPLAPQVFTLAFFQFADVERFIRGLPGREGPAMEKLAAGLLAFAGWALLSGGLSAAALGLAVGCGAMIGMLSVMAKRDDAAAQQAAQEAAQQETQQAMLAATETTAAARLAAARRMSEPSMSEQSMADAPAANAALRPIGLGDGAAARVSVCGGGFPAYGRADQRRPGHGRGGALDDRQPHPCQEAAPSLLHPNRFESGSPASARSAPAS